MKSNFSTFGLIATSRMKSNFSIDFLLTETNFSSFFVQNRCHDYIDFLHEDHEAVIFGKALAMILLVLITIIGNLLVIIAILISNRLRTVTNYLIASLAVSDFVIGIGVLPFSFAQDLLGFWTFGYVWCRIWLALDVWVSTASIYNLVVIAVDRYIAVTRPLTYRTLVTTKKASLAICGTWIWSFLVSFPPMVTFQNSVSNFKPIETDGDSWLILNDCQCTALDNTAAYIVFSASSSFYLPFSALLYLYIKIYLKIRRAASAVDKGYVTLKRRQLRDTEDSSNGTTRYKTDNETKTEFRRCLSKKWKRGISVESNQNVNVDNVTLRVHRGKYNAAGATRNSSQSPKITRSSLSLDRSGTMKSEKRTWQTSGHSEKGTGEKGGLVKSVLLTAAAKKMVPKHKLRNYRSIDSCMDSPPGTCSSPLEMPSFNIKDGRCEWESVKEKGKNCMNEKYDKKLKREVRAAKTVALVTGCFFLCWSGFCIVYTMKALPFCQLENSSKDDTSHCVPSWAFALVLWLGYTNSALNPIIYAACSRQFRTTFRKILCCSIFFAFRKIRRDGMVDVSGRSIHSTTGTHNKLLAPSLSRVVDGSRFSRTQFTSSSGGEDI